jgi:antitoxin MazE
VKRRIKKWGNSAAVRIPAAVLRAANLKIEDAVEVRNEEGRVVIEPKRGQLSLDALVDAITPDNRHDGFDTGPRVGREAW